MSPGETIGLVVAGSIILLVAGFALHGTGYAAGLARGKAMYDNWFADQLATTRQEERTRLVEEIVDWLEDKYLPDNDTDDEEE